MNILKRCKGKSFVLILLFVLNIYVSIKMFYALAILKGIETFIRFLICISVIVISVGFIVTYYRYLKKYGSKYYRLIPISLVYSLILLFSSNFIINTYNAIDNISSNKVVYSSSLIELSTSNTKNINKLKKGSIGIIKDSSSIDGNIIPNEIIKKEKLKNKIVEYDNYIELIGALYDKKVDYVFISTNYVDKLKNINDEKYEKLDEETKIIYTKEKSIKNDGTKKNIMKEPFSILIMGVDSKVEKLKNSVFNGDALMLITFNPNTLSTTMLSIPRDSYVPIVCFNNEKNKITHAAMYGEDCIIKSIEKFTDIKIDYYLKINFKGFVNIIDSLGGINVDVPYSFCEQDSNRKWGKNTIYVEEGFQKLNGEQALALSRNRKNNTSRCSSKWTKGYRSDFVRGENQQLVLKSTLNKIKEINNLDKITGLLEKVSNSMETNMSTNQILSLYNIGKDVLLKSNGNNLEDLIGIKRLHLSGYDAYIYDKRTGLRLYDYVLYNGSIKDVSNYMKINLGIKKPKLIKNFSFNIDEDYEPKVIGSGEYTKEKLPSFIGKNEKKAKELAKKIGIDIEIKYVSSSSNKNGIVLYQSHSSGTDLVEVEKLVLTISKNGSNNVDENEITDVIGIEEID